MKKSAQNIYLVKEFYQIQKHRIAFGGQIKALKDAKQPHKILAMRFKALHDLEKAIAKDLKESVQTEKIWLNYLINVKGIAEILASGLIRLIDIEKADHVSSLWKYAGLDVAPDGLGRSRKKAHLVPKTYKNREGKTVKTQGITFNPLLKSLCWKIGESFIKSNSPYKDFYDQRKKLEEGRNKTRKKADVLTKMHIHNRALRYMVKRFLCDFWIAWRTQEKLVVSQPYVVAKLGHVMVPPIVHPVKKKKVIKKKVVKKKKK